MELRKAHTKENVRAGIDMRDGCISDMYRKNVIQPLLVTTSVIKLAAEIVCMILKVRPGFVFLLSSQTANGGTAIFDIIVIFSWW